MKDRIILTITIKEYFFFRLLCLLLLSMFSNLNKNGIEINPVDLIPVSFIHLICLMLIKTGEFDCIRMFRTSCKFYANPSKQIIYDLNRKNLLRLRNLSRENKLN